MTSDFLQVLFLEQEDMSLPYHTIHRPLQVVTTGTVI